MAPKTATTLINHLWFRRLTTHLKIGDLAKATRCPVETVRRYERGSMLVTSNRAVSEWGTVFGDTVVATAILDRLLHRSHVITIRGDITGCRRNADLDSCRNARQRKNWGG